MHCTVEFCTIKTDIHKMSRSIRKTQIFYNTVYIIIHTFIFFCFFSENFFRGPIVLPSDDDRNSLLYNAGLLRCNFFYRTA